MKPSHPQMKYQNILQSVYRFAQERRIKLYLVGGILRDLLLNRDKENPDIDFCLKKGAINFARKLAGKIHAGFVILDKTHGACRLVKRMEDKIYTLDFMDFRGKTLAEDLLHRDFTINAMALALEDFKNKDPNSVFIDPYGGKKDLKSKIIRMVNKQSLDEDPLRILRAFSLASIFNFRIDNQTIRAIKLKRDKISFVSFERIRDELFKILDRADAFNYLLQLDRLKILKIIIPEIEKMRHVKQGPYHHLDVFEHTFETIRQLETLIQELKNNKEIQNYLNEVIGGDRRRRALIKLGALLHDIGKPAARRKEDGKTKFHGHERIGLDMTEDVAKRLKLSNDELNSLKMMVLWHLRPGYLADNEEITPRARFRYFRDSAHEALSILLISIADQRSTKGPLTSKVSRIQHEKVAFGLMKEYFKRQKEKKPARLINGDQLLKNFKLEPSPLIGKILKELEELQAIGKIKTKSEALKISGKIIMEQDKTRK